MAGKKAYERDSYLTDARTLKARGWTVARIARELGISTRTLYRILGGQ